VVWLTVLITFVCSGIKHSNAEANTVRMHSQPGRRKEP